MTNLNRIRNNNPVPEDFRKDNEIIPLTEIYEDLSIHRLTLTEEFYDLFSEKAKLALTAANVQTQTEWDRIVQEWNRIDEQIREAVEKAFHLSEIIF